MVFIFDRVLVLWTSFVDRGSVEGGGEGEEKGRCTWR